MRLVVALFFCLVSLLVSTAARAETPACAKGDEVRGPNCVHVMMVTGGAFEGSAEVSVVYRVRNGHAVIVWKGLGRIMQSTSEMLSVYVWFIPIGGSPREPTTYSYDAYFDGKSYTQR